MRDRCVLQGVLFLIVTGLSVACGPMSTVQVVTERTYPDAAKRTVQNKLFLIDAQRLPDPALIKDLNNSNWEQFDAKIGHVKDAPTRVMLQGIRLLKEDKYQEAYQMFSNIPDDWLDCQALMLKTDCLYALKKQSIDFHAYYQQAFDCTSSGTVKAIVKTRFRFVTYER